GRELEVHRGAVRRRCARMIRRPERVDELTQDALIVVWRRLGQVKRFESLRAYLLAVAVYLCKNDLRKHTELLDLHDADDLPAPQESVLDAIVWSEEIDEIWAVIGTVLSPRQRRAMELKYRDEHTEEEVARIPHLRTKTGARGVLAFSR